MIAHALRAAGDDPAWIVGGVIPQLGGNAGGGDGLARRRGRRVRPVGVRAPAAGRGRDERRARPPRDLRLGRGAARRARRVARGRPGEPSAAGSWRRTTARSPCRARTTARTRPARSRRSSGSASTRRAARAGIASFTGAERRLELVGERGGVTVIDDYGHNPTELRAALGTARERDRGAARGGVRARTSSSGRVTCTASSATRSGSPTSRS